MKPIIDKTSSVYKFDNFEIDDSNKTTLKLIENVIKSILNPPVELFFVSGKIEEQVKHIYYKPLPTKSLKVQID